MTSSYHLGAGREGEREAAEGLVVSSLAFFFVPLYLGLDPLDSATQGGSSLLSYIFLEIPFKIPSEMSPR